jgi:RHS repeat-associated protein
MRIRSGWRLLMTGSARLARRLAAKGRNGVAVGMAVVMAIALTVVAVVLAGAHHGGTPVQRQWGAAAGRPHRVPAAVTMGRIVNGRVVHEGADRRLPGPVAPPPAGQVKGAVPEAVRPTPLRLPARGRAADKARVLHPPAPAAKPGFNPKTSHVLPADNSANRVVYANADGTRTALEFQSPVNYRRADGQWVPINTTLGPSGRAGRAAPRPTASLLTPTPPATPAPTLYQTPAASPRSSGSPAGTATAQPSSSAPRPSRPAGPTAPARAVPRGGWTERSAAEPVSFAPLADAPALVTLPIDAGHAVSFGIEGAAPAAGRAAGSTVSYGGVAPDADVSFAAGAGMVKEQIILRSAAAPRTWVFPLHLTELHAVMGRGDTVEFATAAGKILAFVPRGFMTDSNVNPHSGDGATSYGVRYSLTKADGRQAIRMTLDSAWLDSRTRKFPVTVDPSVSSVNSGGTTYVESPYDNDYSSDTEIDVGTWDGGTNQAKAFLNFASVASSLQNDTVLGARLGVFNTWSYSCSPRTVYVYPVTSSWSVTGDKSWPGPSTGAEIGQKTFATGWVPLGSTVSPCPASWEGINLRQAGTNLINDWTHGTVADNGLALGASGSDSYAWKKFASDSAPNGDPFLAITYTTDGASYKLASATPVKQVEPGQNGQFAIKVTNTGASTWTASNGYELSYRAYNSAGKLVANHPVFTPMPSTVAPGQTVTVNGTIDALAAGSYAIDFDMYSGATGSSPVAFSAEGIPPFAIGLYVPQPPPVVSNVYPPTGYVSPTLAPQLSTVASTASGTITYSFSITCDPLPGQTCPASVINSGTLSVPYWTVPSADMQWNTPYSWTVTATVNGAATKVGPVVLTPEVPQPDITADLGGSSAQAFDPQSGNFTTSATEAAVASAGPPLEIQRTYNSLDPRATGAFGAGWSSVLDTALQPDGDGSGNVVVTVPDGQEMRFGENGNGSYAAPFGSSDALVHNSAGTWTLMDSSGTQYVFTSAGQISQITEPDGESQTFTDNSSGQIVTVTDTASGRTLQLTWSTPVGALYPHVATVSTSPPVSGQQGYTWSYSYTGDGLSQVCSPANGCTSYSYVAGSHYRSAVLDSGPRSYWQLGDASGATAATDEVDANLGTTNGTYSGVTLGAAGPLAGSSETAASFNGSSSSVALPSNLITDGTNVTIELWFKAASSTASGVLFSYDADPLTKSTGNSDHHDPALYVGGNGELYGELWNGSVDPIHTSVSVDDGNWHYAVLTGSSTSQSLYLDGSLAGTVSGQINQQNMTVDTVGAGFWQDGWPNAYTTVGPTITDPAIGYFNGDIGQVAVYPHALGLPAISSHYALATAASPELSQVTLPSGNVYQQASYDSSTGRLAGYTDPNGGQWTISNPVATGYKATSDSLGEVVRYVTVTDPAGRDEVYGYDALDGGRLVSYSNGVDPAETFGYDAAGFLASVTDADGNLVCFTNDIHGNVLTRTWYPVEPASLPGGGTGSVAGCGGSTASSPACTTSGSPCTTFYSYYYDASNPLDPRNDELTAVRDGRSSSGTSNTYLTSYAYNVAGQLTSVTTPATSDFPNGRTTSYTYSTGTEAGYAGGTIPAGLLLTQTTPGGAQTSYAYYSDGDLAKVTEPAGRSTVYSYDALGRAVGSTVYTNSFPSGLATTYDYNAASQPVTVTYPGVTNQVTGITHTLQDAYAYNSDGNLLSLTQSDLTGGGPSRTTTYTYNDHDQVATMVQPAGATSGGGTQSQGASSPYPQGATTGYDYDPSGNVTSVTDPDGNVFRYSYNEYNEVTGVTLYTSATSQANPVANCTSPATQDPDGGCDLALDSYGYDPAGLLASATDAMGRITNYTYDHDQHLIAVSQTDASTSPTTGRQVTYTYDGAGNLTSQAVSAMSGGAVGTGTVTDYTVDAAGRVDSVLTDPTPSGGGSGYVNRTTAYTYNADNEVTSQTVSDSAGSSATDYGYNSADEMTSQTVLDGGTDLQTTWTYDQNGLPLSMTTPRGNVSGGTPANYTTNYGYDQAGNLATVTGPPVAAQTYQSQTPVTTRPLTTYGYDTYGDQTQGQDPDGNITVTGYDGDGRVTSVTQPSYLPPGASSPISATTSYAYDGDGNLVQMTDPAGNTTSYTYDALGDLTSETDPQLSGQSAPGVWNYTYDAAGELLSATDPMHDTTQATYDYFGNQATVTDARGYTTTFQHDYLGDVTQETTPDGVVSKNTYNHLGELTSAADGYGDTTSYAYNHLGEISQINNPDTSFAQLGYDPAGNLTSVADYSAAPPGQASTLLRSESFGYDPDGNLTSIDDWNGNTSSYSYNAAEELTSQVQPVTSTASNTTSYGYDPAGNQTAITGGNGNTTWTTYNTWNLPESVIEPAIATAPSAADRTWTTSYDADGQASSVSQPGGITQAYGYDPLGDLTSQAGSGAAAPTATQSFGYDLDGRLTSATAPGGTDSFSYNADSELASTSGPSGSSSFSYNDDDLMSSRTDAAGTTSYSYDNADRLATVSDPLTGATLTYGYDSDSLPSSVSYATGGTAGPTRSYLYNGLQELTSDTLTAAGGGTIASAAYGYNADGDLTSQTTTGYAGAGSTSYGYNEADELTSATTGGTTTSYGYDADGNLTQSGATTYGYDAQDQLTTATASAGTTSYGYTLSGALASVTPPSGPAQNYTSNAFGQTAAAPGGISYGYDALGRLATRTVGSSTASFAYSGAGGTIASDGSTSFSYDPAGNLVAARQSGGTAAAVLTNLHGDVTGTVSPGASATSLTASAAYSPYGSVSASSGSMPSLGYQGQYTDPGTGHVDMSARWYSPATGSFTSNDTLGGSPLRSTVDGNPYAYAYGNPLTNADPTGHFLCVECIEQGLELGGSTAGEAGAETGPWDIAIAAGGALVGGFLGWLFGSQSSGSSASSDSSSGEPRCVGLTLACDGAPVNYPAYSWGAPDYGIASAVPIGGAGYPYYGYSSYGYYGGYGYAPVAPPPPPPPPQDCYAGPDPSCSPPPAPHALRTTPYITSPVHFNTSAASLLRGPNKIIETVPPNTKPVSGTSPSPTTNGNPSAAASNNTGNLLTPIEDLQPAPPVAPVPAAPPSGNPADVGAPPGTATPGGSGTGAGGGGGPGLPLMPPVSVKLPQTVAAPAGNGGPSVSTEQQDQAGNCFNSSGPSTYQYGALDTLGGTIKPGRATWAQACLVPPTKSGSGYVPNFPGFNGTIMDRAHLIARQFGGTGGRVNIVPLWTNANRGFGTEPPQMRAIEAEISADLAQGSRVYYYAAAEYSQGTGGAPDREIAPYWPTGISITYGDSEGDLQTTFVPNVP